ncbi:MAG: HAD family hydrolase, partial [Pirellulales bacterium]
GLRAALKEFGLSLHEVVGVGDAENDHAFLSVCECSAAVANALPALKEKADLVTAGDHGAGVVELIDRVLDDDLQSLSGQVTRHHLSIGVGHDGGELRIDPGTARLVAAQQTPDGLPPAAVRLLDSLTTAHYQTVVLAAEPHNMLAGRSVTLGTADNPPTVEELLMGVASPRNSVAVDLSALPLEERTAFTAAALAGLQELRGRTNRPHWIVLHEPGQLMSENAEQQRDITGDWPDNRCLMVAQHSAGLPSLTKGDSLALATDADWLGRWSDSHVSADRPLAEDETWVLRDGIRFRVRTEEKNSSAEPST